MSQTFFERIFVDTDTVTTDRTATATAAKARLFAARARKELRLAPPAGFEPATHGLGNRCSIP